jgi:hypothetical protein
MRVFLKILATFMFLCFWGQLARGCQSGATGAMRALMSIFTLVLLGAGIYGIWKFIPNSFKKDDEIHKLDKD